MQQQMQQWMQYPQQQAWMQSPQQQGWMPHGGTQQPAWQQANTPQQQQPWQQANPPQQHQPWRQAYPPQAEAVPANDVSWAAQRKAEYVAQRREEQMEVEAPART